MSDRISFEAAAEKLCAQISEVDVLAGIIRDEAPPMLRRLAAALAEVKQFAPPNDPARIEAEAALREYREGVAP